MRKSRKNSAGHNSVFFSKVPYFLVKFRILLSKFPYFLGKFRIFLEKFRIFISIFPYFLTKSGVISLKTRACHRKDKIGISGRLLENKLFLDEHFKLLKNFKEYLLYKVPKNFIIF